jgi:selenocysteine-specific elongation factor
VTTEGNNQVVLTEGTQHYTLGIAGHIDHGKTTLTKALTGKNTDRLKEEQLRNISIEPGYASFTLSQGYQVGVVDVPGHERFIRQMVAGVAGIDLVLLVVAADEGVMPQTREHVHILNLLGVKRGIMVLSKADMVDGEWLALVEEDVRSEVQETFLQNAEVMAIDSLSGRGIAALKQKIEAMISTIPSRPVQGITRLPIDRVFTKKGFGTIVTGTIYQGKLSVGDELHILPGEHIVKVRQLQVHDKSVQTAYAGQRTAVNLSDIHFSDVKRGNVLVTKNNVDKTTRIDIECQLLKALDFSIKQRSTVRLHIGTTEVLGRIIFFDRNELLPGESCLAQLELEMPIVTLFEERFVLRRPSPMTTIGGGMVIDPYATKHRFGQETIQLLSAKKEGDITTRAAHLLHQHKLLTVSELTHQLGISISDWQLSLKEKKAAFKRIHVEADGASLLANQVDWLLIWSEIAEALAAFHKRYPLREGMERLKLQKRFFPFLTTTQFQLVLREASKDDLIRVKQDVICLFDFQDQLREKDLMHWQRIEAMMLKRQIEVPAWSELAPKEITSEQLEDLKQWLIRHKQLILLDDQRYISHRVLLAMLDQLKTLFPEQFSIQEAREVFSVSRKYMIPFLEALDREGFTKRIEGMRKWT